LSLFSAARAFTESQVSAINRQVINYAEEYLQKKFNDLVYQFK